jgi:D-glycero-D-manno-heptose 1,7-bisphosphate phosphatase
MNRPFRRVLFLDRDGIVNRDHGYVFRPDQTEWVPGIFELCRAALDLGFELVVVTNQAGIARGLYTEAQFLEYTRWMTAQFRDRGIPILATYHCPHHPTAGSGPLTRACDCRKPAPGMLLQAARDWDIDLVGSALIGDKDSDIEAGNGAGVGHCFKVVGGADGGLAPATAWLARFAAQGEARRSQ